MSPLHFIERTGTGAPRGLLALLHGRQQGRPVAKDGAGSAGLGFFAPSPRFKQM
jgi:hypothetical protein